MDEISPSTPQPLKINAPLAGAVVAADSIQEDKPAPLVLTREQIDDLSRLIFKDFDLEQYALHHKVLMDASLFLEKKLDHKNFNFKINLHPQDTKKAYLENPDKEKPYSRIWLDLSFPWYQEKPSKKVLEKLVSDLNKEFNLERRFGLFLLEESSNGYSIYFNPNELNEASYDYINSDRYLSRAMCPETFHPFDRLNEDELFVLHMENSFLETVLGKHALDPRFEIIRYRSIQGLQTWIYNPFVRKNLLKEIADWNLEYNVGKRAGVFRFNNYGPYFGLWFQPSIGNKGYEDLKKEFLTDKAIAQLERKFDIVFDNHSEWTFTNL